MSKDKDICDFGFHRGEPYTALPATFLNWMVETSHIKSNFAKNELQRRLLAVENARNGTKKV
jgi:hypothetical protein